MFNKPFVSVIILNYNTFSLTCKCISSIFSYTKEVDYEIILVDNASTECDATEFLKLFPSIILIRNDNNLGFSKGNNIGIERSTGKYLVLMNSDIELTEDSVSKCCDFLGQHNQVGILSPRLIYPTGTVQYLAERFPNIRLELLQLSRSYLFMSKKKKAKVFLSYFFDHKTDRKADYVWGAFLVLRKNAVKRLPVGKLNDDFFMYAEDMVWCYDMAKIGFETWYFAGTTAKHIHSYSLNKSHANGNKKKLRLMLKNKYAFLKKEKGKLYTFIYRVLEFFNALTRFNFLKAGEVLKSTYK